MRRMPVPNLLELEQSKVSELVVSELLRVLHHRMLITSPVLEKVDIGRAHDIWQLAIKECGL
jgi:hypothetical protein